MGKRSREVKCKEEGQKAAQDGRSKLRCEGGRLRKTDTVLSTTPRRLCNFSSLRFPLCGTSTP